MLTAQIDPYSSFTEFIDHEFPQLLKSRQKNLADQASILDLSLNWLHTIHIFYTLRSSMLGIEC